MRRILAGPPLATQGQHDPLPQPQEAGLRVQDGKVPQARWVLAPKRLARTPDDKAECAISASTSGVVRATGRIGIGSFREKVAAAPIEA